MPPGAAPWRHRAITVTKYKKSARGRTPLQTDTLPSRAASTSNADALPSALLPAAFAATLFTSATLLFAVQPMVSRMVLPRLGGTPAVWNTCICFFQIALLLGYAYADWSAVRLRPTRQLILHAAVLLCGVALMPLSIGAAVPQPHASPAVWLLGRLAITIGPPFLALSATAPLLQHWFSRTDQPRAADPYFLYAASNTGSLLALLSYPLVLEPFIGLTAQTRLWSVAFCLCAGAVLLCGAASLRQRAAAPRLVAASPHSAGVAALAAARQLRWIGLAFVPSGLMLAVTTYITTDIAAAPLFWVIPLSIYIFTFMLAFGRARRAMPRALPILQAIALAAAGVTALMGVPGLPALAIALAVFTLTALVCHLELASARPDPRHLTRYFLLISIGGALGGVFNAFVAPMLFHGPWEYPILLVAACALRPVIARRAAPPQRASRPLLLLLAGIVLVLAASPYAPAPIRLYGRILGIALPAGALLWFSRRGAYLGVGLASMLTLPLIVRAVSAEHTVRSFFGTYRVVHIPAEDITILQHGTTLHGVQSDRPGEEKTPLSYYALTGSFDRLFHALRTRPTPLRSIGVIGLGTGELGCYAQPGEHWTFREIDPAVERLARDPRYFHFLANCGNDPTILIGDGRITLTQDSNARYDLLIMDAFSSDSVPMHLLTREALALYFSRLNPGGVVVFHISNRYLNLAPVIARLAADAGAPARHLLVPSRGGGFRFTPAELIAIAAPGGNLDVLAADGWDVPQPGPALWTDERSDIVSVIRW
jgi:hypothetical protein